MDHDNPYNGDMAVVDKYTAQIIVLSPLRSDVHNSEIDNSANYVKHNVHGVTFELTKRYEPPIEALGRGGYGFVGSARLAGTNKLVAVKKITNAFRNIMDARRVLREVIIQRHMEHPNIASVKDVLLPPKPSSFSDVYITYDLMPSDLQQVIQSEQQLTDRHCRHILVQLLRALKYLHSANVLHRDLKPSNILIDERCNIRVTDFGLSRTRLGTEEHMTQYVVTRWYRAPELLMNCHMHSRAVDLWAVGCIFMELVSRKVFIKGRDPLDQLRKILETVGTPEEHDLSFLETAEARRFVMMQKQFPKKSFLELCPTMSPLGADLAQKMLVFDPRQRITVDQALAHPYLANNRDVNRELVCALPLKIDLSFEHEHYTMPIIKQLLYEVGMDFAR